MECELIAEDLLGEDRVSASGESEIIDEEPESDMLEELEEEECLDEYEVEEQSSTLTKEQLAKLQEIKNNSPNLWKHEEVPHSEWNCVGVEDLGAPVGICEMCGYQIIRYAHHMEHAKYRPLICGCICAGKMEGDIAEAKRREAEVKKKQARRVNFFNKKWKYSIDGTFCKNHFTSRERALASIFEELESLRKGN